MFSFLREENKDDGTPGPLSMRRLAAALCLLSAIGAAVFALIIIFKAIAVNPATEATPIVTDWKVFFPMFIPCLAFLLSCIILLFFTTWEDIKGIVCAAGELKSGGKK
jgi:hypothetical protein